MNIAPETMRRLAFTKYLHASAEQQSRAPGLRNSASLLEFHDAVEMFLLLANEHMNTGLPARATFEQYWAPLSEKLGAALPKQTAMRRLNDARVSLKHRGQLPSAADVSLYRETCSEFFALATPLIFGIEFSAISLAAFVEPHRARVFLQAAASCHASGDKQGSAENFAMAFDALLKHYTDHDPLEMGRQSPYDFGRDLRFARFSSSRRGDDRALEDFSRAVIESIEPMRRSLKILALGLDYRSYSRFKWLTPIVHTFAAGNTSVEWNRLSPEDIDDVSLDFCESFVVDSALRLASVDA
ncbi:hypothetical protein [Ramlibacter sp.]|uniref:hypothetical protein n=1 Tax=Ramlibacter sp. TaxID=1917967 RepID=UPI003D146915